MISALSFRIPSYRTVAFALLIALNLLAWAAGRPPAPGPAAPARDPAPTAPSENLAARMQMLALFADNLPEPTAYPEMLEVMQRVARSQGLALQVTEKPWVAPPGASFLHAPVQLSVTAPRARLHAFVKTLLDHNGALILEGIRYHRPPGRPGPDRATLDLLLVMKP